MSRTRTKILAPQSDEFIYVTKLLGNVNTAPQGPYLVSKDFETMSDTPTPGYAKKIAAGKIINNPMSYEKYERTSEGTGHGDYQSASTHYQLDGPITRYRWGTDALPSHVNLQIENLIDEAKAKALADIDSTPFEFGEDLAELGSTIRTLSGAFGALPSIARGFKNFRKNLVKSKGLSAADAFTDAWLQYRFFLSPLVRSAQDAMEAYANGPGTVPIRRNARGFAGDNGSSVTNPTKASGRIVFESTHIANVHVHAHIHYELTNPIQGLRQHLGIRNKDIPAIMWQIFPYSFMVDRVSDITSFIQGAVNFTEPRLAFLAGSVTVRTDDTKILRHLSHAPTSGWTVSESGEIITEKSFTMTRNIWSPTITDTLPGFNLERLVADATSIVDLFTLARAYFRH